MNINDSAVLDMLNSFIASNRLNNVQILQVVKLALISNDIKDLKNNIEWESIKSKY